MLHFEHSSWMAAPVETVWAFHERPDAIERLMPPWPKTEVVCKEGGLRVGAIVVLRLWVGPVPVRWVAHHIGYQRGEYFVDEQREGPLAAWVHHHHFQAEEGGTRLTDSITYELPGGRLAQAMAGRFSQWQLTRLFRYRHDVTRAACAA